MDNNPPTYKKRHGVFYTPESLANKLSESLITGENVSILDPAYGDGSLLLAAEKIFNERASSNSSVSLFGCDINPINGLLEHLPKANLKECNFFNYHSDIKHDVILTNPPFIRHQYLDKNAIKSYKSHFDRLAFLSNISGLWAYFIVQSTYHLKKGGAIGAILPWSFIQADYARELRLWLFKQFGEIELLALNEEYFESAQERVVLLWLRNYGSKNSSLKSALSKRVEDKFEMKDLPLENWQAQRLNQNTLGLKCVFDKIRTQYGFTEFGNYADTRIGVVTGADKFFIRPQEDFSHYGINETQLIPIITAVKEIPDYLVNGEKNLKRLACIYKSNSDKHSQYISEGVEKAYHLRAHSLLREPWFTVKQGNVPDAFFPYRVGRIPFLILNKHRVQSTNSIHRIYFKKLSLIEKKWIAVSLISIYGQLCLEFNAKCYGRGMLKTEPGTLKSVLVVVKKERSVIAAYDKIIECLIKEDKDAAVQFATEFINSKLEITKELQIAAKLEWDKFQAH